MDLLDFILMLMALSTVCSDFFSFNVVLWSFQQFFQLHWESDVCIIFD